MVRFAKALKAEDTTLAPEIVSIGSTPTTRLAESFKEGITEIRPGNYVFFDYTQVALGSCDLTDCAFTVQASVISTIQEGLVIDAGATALSLSLDASGGYGRVIRDYSKSVIASELKLSSLSQEHGKIIVEGGHQLNPGDRLRIIPNHSCITANLFDHYFVVRGNSVVDKWKINRQRL